MAGSTRLWPGRMPEPCVGKSSQRTTRQTAKRALGLPTAGGGRGAGDRKQKQKKRKRDNPAAGLIKRLRIRREELEKQWTACCTAYCVLDAALLRLHY